MVENLSMRELVASVGGFQENRKALWATAARKSKLSYRTIKSIWYGEINDPEHKAIRRLQAIDTGPAVHASRLETIKNGLEATDPDYFGPDIAALVHAIRALRGLDMSRDDSKD